MKRLFVFNVFICLLSIKLAAQISIMESQPQIKKYNNYVYDSLKNVTEELYEGNESFHHLIGQTLMFCGNKTGQKNDDFREKKFIIGDYYIVEDVLADIPTKGLYGRMVLKNLKTGKKSTDGLFWRKHNNYRWVSLGHYEKLNKLYKGKEFVYMKNYSNNELLNFGTDTTTCLPDTGSIWKCLEIQVKIRTDNDGYLGDRSPIVFVVESPIYGKHYCYLEDFMGVPYKSYIRGGKNYICGMFKTKSDYDRELKTKQEKKEKLTKLYGKNKANKIIEGIIEIGMTKEMCIEAWGEPDQINQTITDDDIYEQWVYDYNYVYFDGNEITAIQD